MSMQANFFLIGAAKAGTTSIANQLDAHPDVYVSPIKEPNYFSSDIDPSRFSSNYRNNTMLDTDAYFAKEILAPLHLSFVREESQYARLFDAALTSAAGECSTSYLFSKDAAKNIAAYNPDAKIIAVLRNPVERCFSHYLMAYKMGLCTLDFREALEADAGKNEKGWGISELFIELGMYAEGLKRYYACFPKEQILVLLFDQMVQSPQEFYDILFDFLGVEKVNITKPIKSNSAGMPRMAGLNTLISRLGVKKMVKKFMPQKAFDKVKFLYYSEKNIPKLLPDDREFLSDIYRDDILKTQEITGIDLRHWLK